MIIKINIKSKSTAPNNLPYINQWVEEQKEALEYLLDGKVSIKVETVP